MPPAPPARGFSTSPSSDSSEEPALIGQVLGNRYRILSILGSGGMGMVYEAEHLGLERPVAVKVLNPLQAKKKNTVKRFQQEARAAGGIGHPNICEVYDMGWLEDGCPYLVMERLHGQTLADRVRKSGGLPFLEAVEVMCQVLAGLMAAHEKGIMHRDIKPENIFLSRRPNADPIAKILDFGVSKGLAGGPEEPLDLTRTGMVMGTPYYMSPEQARGERNLDVRVDVYACGVMLYECLTGRRPFVAPNYNALLLQILTESPRPARDHRPDLPPAFESVMRRAMARSRDDRYPTAAALRRDLIAIGKQLGMAAEPSAGRRLEDPAARPVTGGHVRPAMPVQQAQPQQPPQAPPQPHAQHVQHLQPQHPQHAPQHASHAPQHASHAPQAPHVQQQHAQPVQPTHKPAKPTQLPAHPTLASPQHPLHAQAPSYAHNVQHAPSSNQGAPQPAPQAPMQSRVPAAPRPAAGMPARPTQAPQAPPVPQTPKPQTSLFSPQAPQAPQAPGGVINPNAPSKRRQTVRMTSPVATPSASQAGYLPPLPMPPAPAHAQPPRPSPPSREEKLRAPLAGPQPRAQEADELPKLYDTSPSTDGTPSRSVHERKALGAAFDARVAQSRGQTAPQPPHASPPAPPVRAPISNRAPAPAPAHAPAHAPPPHAPHASGHDFSDAPTYVISRDEIMGAMASHLGPQSSGPTEVSEWDAETTVTTAPPDWHELVHGHGAHELEGDRDTDAGEASYHPVAPYSPPAPPPPAAGRPAQKPADAHADLQRRLEDEYGDMPLDDATLVHRGRLPRRK